MKFYLYRGIHFLYQINNIFSLHLTGVAILTFSSLVYICEFEFAEQVPVNWRNKTIMVPQNGTWTFLESFWWGLMTLTTVGYDTNPKVRTKKTSQIKNLPNILEFVGQICWRLDSFRWHLHNNPSNSYRG